MTHVQYRRGLLLGVAARLGWALWKMHGGIDMAIAAEAFDEARHLAPGQGWAGAYRDDVTTAHLLPIAPGIAGGVYALLGVATPAAELTLWGYATALAIATRAIRRDGAWSSRWRRCCSSSILRSGWPRLHAWRWRAGRAGASCPSPG